MERRYLILEKEMDRFADFLTNLISKYAHNLDIDQMPAPEKIDDVLEKDTLKNSETLVSKIER